MLYAVRARFRNFGDSQAFIPNRNYHTARPNGFMTVHAFRSQTTRSCRGSMYGGTDPSKLFDHHDGIAGSFVLPFKSPLVSCYPSLTYKLPVARISGGFSQPSVV